MADGFKKILIPVDFSINTEVAIKKAIELAVEGTQIHLVNIQSDLPLALFPGSYKYLKSTYGESGYKNVEKKLNHWKNYIEESTDKVTVSTRVSSEYYIQGGIEEEARKVNADLIIVGKNSHHSWFPFLNTVTPSKLASQTGIPVLSVKPGSIHARVQKIIVPVTDGSIKDKLDMIKTLCGRFKLKIYLVTFIDESGPSEFNASALLQAYQWIKNMNCAVEYTVLHGANKARELLNYAQTINADMLLVNPYSETKIGWFNRQISDVLPSDSKVQVLAVSPA